MRIMYVAHERNLGGASKSLVTLTEEMKERGHEITVVIPFKSGQVYAKLKENGIDVYRIFFGWWMMPRNWNGIMKLAFRFLHGVQGIAVKKIARLAEKKQIDVIHSNSSAIDAGACAARRAGVPHVWHFREFGDLDYNLEFLKGKKKSCAFVSETPGKAVFISKNLREYYRDEIDDKKSTVIYNGIAEQFLQDKYGQTKNIPREEVTFLIAGNLHPGKHQELALEAGRKLLEQGVTNWKLLIAGAASQRKDSKEFEESLRDYAKEYLADKVTFLGRVTDMPKLRSRTEVELVCSGMEAFGRVTVEAMMASNPVIGADTGATPELIDDGENGYLFESGNAGSLAEKMLKFIENPQEMVRMGKNAYRYAKENFPSARNTERIEQLYKELITEN